MSPKKLARKRFASSSNRHTLSDPTNAPSTPCCATACPSNTSGRRQHRGRLCPAHRLEDVTANDWLAVNQFTVVEGQNNRRPDIVVFVNGLPLAVIELKNLADEDATIWTAFQQLQTYKKQIGSLFHYNEILVVSDGGNATHRIANRNRNGSRFAQH